MNILATQYWIIAVIVVVLAIVFLIRKSAERTVESLSEENEFPFIERRKYGPAPVISSPSTIPIVRNNHEGFVRSEYMEKRLHTFMEKLENLFTTHRQGNRSLVTFTTEVLTHLSGEFRYYLFESKNKRQSYSNYPVYHRILMHAACGKILEYTDGRGLDEITDMLINFGDKHLNINAKTMNQVLNRHKGQVEYVVRRYELSKSILDFHCNHIQETQRARGVVPFDVLEEDLMMPWTIMHQLFFVRAIDNSYAMAMKASSKIRYEAQTRNENQEHRKRRHQKHHRESKQKRKVRKT